VGVVNLADRRPLALDFQQVEEVGETEAGNVVGVDTRAGSRVSVVRVFETRSGLN
jgi:hypothetical protein